MDNELGQVILTPPEYDEKQENSKEYIFGKRPKRTFTYDAVYPPEYNNQQIYDTSFSTIVKRLTEGFNATIFFYGQSGSGKSFTYRGDESKQAAISVNNIGCCQQAFNTIFDYMASTPNRQFMVKCSNLEIYNEEVRDLIDLKRTHLVVRETKQKGTFVDNLSEYTVKSTEECLKYLDIGQANRAVASHGLNEVSSRSHCIFQLRFEQQIPAEQKGGKPTYTTGVLSLADLAGSERTNKTHAQGQTLKEGCAINKSLFTLGVVIQSLADKKDFIPYRDSILTRLLQNGLGGNSKTLLCANINPCSTNYDETLSTCLFAYNAKKIINVARINEDPKDSMIREMKEKIKQLEQRIQEAMLQKNLSPEQIAAMKGLLQQMKGETIVEEEVIEVEDVEQAKQRDEVEQKKAEIKNALDDKQRNKLETDKLIEEMKRELGDMKNDVIDGSSLQNQVEQREREIREARAKLAQKQERERERLRKIAEQQRQLKEKEQLRIGVEDQIKAVKQQIEQVKQRCMEVDQEITLSQKQQEDSLTELNQQIEQVQKEINRKQLIIDNFIPQYEVMRSKQLMWYDQQQEKLRMANKEQFSALLNKVRDISIVFPKGNVIAEIENKKSQGEQNIKKSQIQSSMNTQEQTSDRQMSRRGHRRPYRSQRSE